MLKDLGIIPKFISPTMLIQQMEKLDGGLSDVEVRALRDLGDNAGAIIVKVIGDTNVLPKEEVLLMLHSKMD
jgi:hypothetical protein